MADLFLSYAQEDRECAELMASALTERGWNVWWDRRIQVGRSFSDVIERQLDQARCVVVLWSHASVRSEWVQNEAAEAARKNRLVPVRIEDVRPPLEFRRRQTADLLDWQDGLDHSNLAACIESIEFLAGHTASRPLPAWTIFPDNTAPSNVSSDPVMAAVNVAAAAKQRVTRRKTITLLSALAIVWVGQFYDGNENKGVLMLEIAIIAALFIFCWDRMRWPFELLRAYGRGVEKRRHDVRAAPRIDSSPNFG
ncbi:MAG TPA: toll/interleukin-1 receptor domain-containing protein [Thermoanaerobaculia bacterium]